MQVWGSSTLTGLLELVEDLIPAAEIFQSLGNAGCCVEGSKMGLFGAVLSKSIISAAPMPCTKSKPVTPQL